MNKSILRELGQGRGSVAPRAKYEKLKTLLESDGMLEVAEVKRKGEKTWFKILPTEKYVDEELKKKEGETI